MDNPAVLHIATESLITCPSLPLSQIPCQPMYLCLYQAVALIPLLILLSDGMHI